MGFGIGGKEVFFASLVTFCCSPRESLYGASVAASSGESLEGATLLFSPLHPMRRLKAKSEIKCFMLITNY
jgi:hypothetical protein